MLFTPHKTTYSNTQYYLENHHSQQAVLLGLLGVQIITGGLDAWAYSLIFGSKTGVYIGAALGVLLCFIVEYSLRASIMGLTKQILNRLKWYALILPLITCSLFVSWAAYSPYLIREKIVDRLAYQADTTIRASTENMVHATKSDSLALAKVAALKAQKNTELKQLDKSFSDQQKFIESSPFKWEQKKGLKNQLLAKKVIERSKIETRFDGDISTYQNAASLVVQEFQKNQIAVQNAADQAKIQELNRHIASVSRTELIYNIVNWTLVFIVVVLSIKAAIFNHKAGKKIVLVAGARSHHIAWYSDILEAIADYFHFKMSRVADSIRKGIKDEKKEDIILNYNNSRENKIIHQSGGLQPLSVQTERIQEVQKVVLNTGAMRSDIRNSFYRRKQSSKQDTRDKHERELLSKIERYEKETGEKVVCNQDQITFIKS